MNIGFDLDKIFIDYPPFIPAKIIDSLYKKKSNGILNYRIPSKPEQIFRLITHQSFLRPPIMENINVIKNLINRNKNNYYLISSRFHFLKNKTNNLIRKYEFKKIFNEMFFNYNNKQPHIFKNEVIKKLKIDRYVDDDLHLLKFLAQNNPKVTFFWLNPKEKKQIKNNLFSINKLSEMFSS